MSDSTLRELEREAAAGDPDAEERLHRARLRAGIYTDVGMTAEPKPMLDWRVDADGIYVHDIEATTLDEAWDEAVQDAHEGHWPVDPTERVALGMRGLRFDSIWTDLVVYRLDNDGDVYEERQDYITVWDAHEEADDQLSNFRGFRCPCHSDHRWSEGSPRSLGGRSIAISSFCRDCGMRKEAVSEPDRGPHGREYVQYLRDDRDE